MTFVDIRPRPSGTLRNHLYGWAVFLLIVFAATWLFGPIALMVCSVVAGAALVVTGARARSWVRPALIVAGALLVISPVVMLLDVALGGWQVTVR